MKTKSSKRPTFRFLTDEEFEQKARKHLQPGFSISFEKFPGLTLDATAESEEWVIRYIDALTDEVKEDRYKRHELVGVRRASGLWGDYFDRVVLGMGMRRVHVHPTSESRVPKEAELRPTPIEDLKCQTLADLGASSTVAPPPKVEELRRKQDVKAAQLTELMRGLQVGRKLQPQQLRASAHLTVLGVGDVAALLAVSTRAVRMMVSRGDLAKPKQITPSHVGWRLSEFEKWLDTRPDSELTPRSQRANSTTGG